MTPRFWSGRWLVLASAAAWTVSCTSKAPSVGPGTDATTGGVPFWGGEASGGLLSTISSGGAGAGHDAGGNTHSPTGGQDGGGASGGSGHGGELGSGGTGGEGGEESAGGGAGGNAAGIGGGVEPAPVAPSVEKRGESVVTNQGLQVISYGGYLNGESFQQDGIVTFGGVQYTAFWNASRHVVLAGRTLPDGNWENVELTDYKNTADDAHNTISIGISPRDETLHLSFDHHDDALHYRRSTPGFLAIEPTQWQLSDFEAVTSSLDGDASVQSVTYPRFITSPDGNTLLLVMRLGASGSGNSHLFSYDGASSRWTARGPFIDGVSIDENPYLHGVGFSADTRLHFSWCTRATPDATTNHDLFYVYSDDGGTTFWNNAGEPAGAAGSEPLGATDPMLRVWQIPQDRGLINQEDMLVAANGEVHVLLSHMPDDLADDSNFSTARSKSEFFHYHRATDGKWSRTSIGASVIANFRGSLARSFAGNIYAILPDLRIFGAAKETGYDSFVELANEGGRFFSDPLVDVARLRQEDVLSLFYPKKDSGEIYVLDYELD